MELIEWNESLYIGIKSVDEQHKMLVNILNNLNNTLQKQGEPDEIVQAFDAVKVYTIKHFKYEEDLFKQYNYPETKEHIQEHHQLIEQLETLHQGLLEGNIMIGVELLTFLKEWLQHHILETDKAFIPFFISKGVE